MLKLKTLMVGTHDPKKLAEFYEEVFDKKVDWQEGTWYGFDSDGFSFTIGEHSEVKGSAKEPQRLILNFETKEVKEEFERIKKVKGVKIIKEPYEIQGMWIATLADPDGNYFQLAPPWDSN